MIDITLTCQLGNAKSLKFYIEVPPINSWVYKLNFYTSRNRLQHKLYLILYWVNSLYIMTDYFDNPLKVVSNNHIIRWFISYERKKEINISNWFSGFHNILKENCTVRYLLSVWYMSVWYMSIWYKNTN